MSAYARRKINNQQRQQQIQAALKNNQHTLVQMNSDEFFDFMFNVQCSTTQRQKPITNHRVG